MGWLDWLYPKTCVGCGSWGGYLCAECVNMVGRVEEPICPVCARPAMFGMTHARCGRAWGMDGLVATMAYKGVVRRMIGKLKYRMVREVYPVLVELVASVGEMPALEQGAWWVTEVPLHARRERWRGFNQADLLAEALGNYFGWKHRSGVLKRVKQTKPQMVLKRSERLKNMRGVFALAVDKGTVRGKQWVVVDDVWTTGATMRECGKILKRAGAEEVWGLVLAR